MTRLAQDWIRLAAIRIAEQRAWLTELDAAIGDGDHGINLDRGFSAVVARFGTARGADEEPGALLQVAGRTILATVGGASGALYGRALMRAGARLEGTDGAPADAAAALAEAVAAISALGRSRAGEKTMLDALVPASEAFAAGAARGDSLAMIAPAAADAAEAGARATIQMVATKGRASYLGERSRGHLDPGAASSALLVRAFADVVAGG